MYKHKNGITLKKVSKEDLQILMDLKNESWFGTHNIVFVNIEDQLKWFDSINDKSIFLIAIDENTQEKVGIYKIQNIDWINRRYDSAHDVFLQHRGKGYGKKVLEAGVDFGFEVLNMNRLDTEVLENNMASMKSAIFVGYVKEGVRRKAIHKCGQYLDSIILGITRDDWNGLHRVQNYGGICNTSYTPKNEQGL
jgi:RimJ/RimL family protein N-acetyltransferase